MGVPAASPHTEQVPRADQAGRGVGGRRHGPQGYRGKGASSVTPRDRFEVVVVGMRSSAPGPDALLALGLELDPGALPKCSCASAAMTGCVTPSFRTIRPPVQVAECPLVGVGAGRSPGRLVGLAKTTGRMMLVSTPLVKSYWPWAVGASSWPWAVGCASCLRSGSSKPDVKIMLFCGPCCRQAVSTRKAGRGTKGHRREM